MHCRAFHFLHEEETRLIENVTTRRSSRNSKSLTLGETATLDRLRGLDDASRRADHAYENLFHHHRGSYLNRGVCVVYGNDGFLTDVRSQREAARVALKIEAMGYEVEGFGLSEDGYSWALVVRFKHGTPKSEREYIDWRLNAIVSDVWFEMAGLGPDFATKIAVVRGL